MITLTLIRANNDTPYILYLPEEDWEFSIRLGSERTLNDNFLTIANPDKNFSNSQDIIAFYNLLKETPPANITKVTLEVDNEEMFDSDDFNFYFLGMFLQYQFVYMETNINRGARGNKGLNIFLNFSNQSSSVNNDEAILPEANMNSMPELYEQESQENNEEE